jgi:hypothetical protein
MSADVRGHRAIFRTVASKRGRDCPKVKSRFHTRDTEGHASVRGPPARGESGAYWWELSSVHFTYIRHPSHSRRLPAR